MVNTTDKLKNVNLMTKAQYDGISNLAFDELYAVETPTIVETYSDAAGNWYRIYSDGWIEQGGISNITLPNSGTSGNGVNLLKPFNDINYTVIPMDYSPSTIAPVTVLAKTLTNFTLHSYGNQSTKQMWYACGQGE